MTGKREGQGSSQVRRTGSERPCEGSRVRGDSPGKTSHGRAGGPMRGIPVSGLLPPAEPKAVLTVSLETDTGLRSVTAAPRGR